MTAKTAVPVALLAMALLAAAMFTAGCKDEEIPIVAPGPYLFSNLAITKATFPPPGTRLTPGSTFRLRFSVAYTLDPAAFRDRSSLGMFINLFGRTPTDSLVGIGGFPDKLLSLTAESGILRDSINVTLPAGIRTFTVEAFLDTLPFANPVMAIDTQIWPVQ